MPGIRTILPLQLFELLGGIQRGVHVSPHWACSRNSIVRAGRLIERLRQLYIRLCRSQT
jgi:hypothetical protein